MSVRHTVTATGVDSGNGLISKNAWNADHVVTSSGCKLLLNTAYTLAANATIDFDQVTHDTNGYASRGYATGSYTLTGTVSVTSGSTTVTGSGTKFTTELSVGMIIAATGCIGTVRTITSDTSVDLWQPAFSNQSGVAVNRRTGVTIPTGMAGYYLVNSNIDWSRYALNGTQATLGTRSAYVYWVTRTPSLMAQTLITVDVHAETDVDSYATMSTIAYLNEYDILSVYGSASGYLYGAPNYWDQYTTFMIQKV